MRLFLSLVFFLGILFVGFFFTGFLLLAQTSFALVVPPISLVIGAWIACKIYMQGNSENGSMQIATNQTRNSSPILLVCLFVVFGALLIAAYFTENPVLSFVMDKIYRIFGL